MAVVLIESATRWMAIGLVATAASARAADLPSTLHTNDGDVVAACMGAGLAAMRDDVRREALGRAEQDAWQLVHALACARGAEAHRVIAAHLRGHVAYRIEPEPADISYVDADSDRLRDGYLKGFAWGAWIDSRQRDLFIQFATSEYCGAGATLRFDGRAWWLVELGSLCD
jgi:hypothetical protein